MLFTLLTILLVSSLSSANYDFRDVDGAPIISQSGDGIGPCGLLADLWLLISYINGINFRYVPTPLTPLITAVQDNDKSIGLSATFITAERQKRVDFAQYLQSGNVFLVQSTYNEPINDLNDLCGKTVTVLVGTVHEADVRAQQADCPSSRPLIIVPAASQTELINNVQQNKADTAVYDESVLVTVARNSNNQLKVVGKPYNIRPYGIMCNKNNRDVCCAITVCKSGANEFG
ncbi:unnamed protein product [Rotaria sordida]|uniref:Solute-binding protein family 3/N-terminal domain-containing protein n=1 Tax=Rotaria sordida TaxID=392033 RepID=A0A813V988_9BILA|nr:unnamed protein product [Rotaria sordida]